MMLLVLATLDSGDGGQDATGKRAEAAGTDGGGARDAISAACGTSAVARGLAQ